MLLGGGGGDNLDELLLLLLVLVANCVSSSAELAAYLDFAYLTRLCWQRQLERRREGDDLLFSLAPVGDHDQTK